jgi:hypothetical protein
MDLALGGCGLKENGCETIGSIFDCIKLSKQFLLGLKSGACAGSLLPYDQYVP